MKNLIKHLNILFMIFLIIVLKTVTVYSQPVQQWVQRYNGAGNDSDFPADIKTDSAGNVYVTGNAVGNAGSQANYVTIKYNKNGISQWTAIYNGTGNDYDYPTSMAIDKLGNVYVTGGSFGSGTDIDIVTIKYTSAGIQQWAVRYDGVVSGSDVANKIILDDSGNVYITGYTARTSFIEDFITIKYNTNGVEQWKSFYNGPSSNSSDIAIDLACDNLKNIYVVGQSYGSSRNDFLIIKYKPNGDSLFSRRYNEAVNNDDIPKAMILDDSANIYVTGFTDYVGNNNSDFLTVKYDSSGSFRWSKKYNNSFNNFDAGFSIARGMSGNIYVSGYSTRMGTNTDYALIKYSRGGLEKWVSFYNGPPGNGQDRANAMAIDKNENIYLTGYSWSTSIGNDLDFATVKFDSSGTQKWVKRYDGPGVVNDQAYAIALDNSGNVFVTGSSKGISSHQDYATIKYSQQLELNLRLFIEGLYNSTTNSQHSDTIRVYLRQAASPYSLIDSAVSIDSSSGNSISKFNNAQTGTYYIVVKYRNGIETWSKTGGESLNSDGNNLYDFSNAASKAYGNNLKLVDSNPLTYAVYSGDVNQTGTIDVVDISLIDNDVFNFVTGYVATDLTGDGTVDVVDIAIADNNAFNFVSKITPP